MSYRIHNQLMCRGTTTTDVPIRLGNACQLSSCALTIRVPYRPQPYRSMLRGGEFRPSPHQGRTVQFESQSDAASALFGSLGQFS
ncbi:hypothetical protein HBI56_197950 [Parastagonospora nodorum]|nr:hypothetical protein HBH56_202660 [Parastagonospora nodorum]KAH3923997.1 hypothetical protein HBH54_201530 [Parastagonospora nodorum]KAH3959610.1 hypothetical protein HBH51_197990 [Parastagonospora nodorum]KAH4010572.1 hypothetical protein HBI09_230380 [Parastagonospora nodorum]KAH4010628.1 hypothetical protein HBI13_205180 [Parastagonospora nodorum]